MGRPYWKCADCGQKIGDENMHDFTEETRSNTTGFYRFRHSVEFCYGCLNYNPEVVIGYR